MVKDYKTATMGKDDVEVARKIKHVHTYRYEDIGKPTAKCVRCDHIRSREGTWVTGKETTPAT